MINRDSIFFILQLDEVYMPPDHFKIEPLGLIHNTMYAFIADFNTEHYDKLELILAHTNNIHKIEAAINNYDLFEKIATTGIALYDNLYEVMQAAGDNIILKFDDLDMYTYLRHDDSWSSLYHMHCDVMVSQLQRSDRPCYLAAALHKDTSIKSAIKVAYSVFGHNTAINVADGIMTIKVRLQEGLDADTVIHTYLPRNKFRPIPSWGLPNSDIKYRWVKIAAYSSQLSPENSVERPPLMSKPLINIEMCPPKLMECPDTYYSRFPFPDIELSMAEFNDAVISAGFDMSSDGVRIGWTKKRSQLVQSA
jgi:hypothetical protein